MVMRERLEQLRRLGWTLKDLIEVVGEIERLEKFKPEDVSETKKRIAEARNPNARTAFYDRTCNLMREMMIYPNLRGYRYIIDAVMIYFESGSKPGAVTHELYPKIAEMNETTSSKVESGIRHAIEKSWERISEEKKAEILGDQIVKRPTNTIFLGIIYEKLSREFMLYDGK